MRQMCHVIIYIVGIKAFVRPIVAEKMLIIQTKNWRFSIELAKTLQYFKLWITYVNFFYEKNLLKMELTCWSEMTKVRMSLRYNQMQNWFQFPGFCLEI